MKSIKQALVGVAAVLSFAQAGAQPTDKTPIRIVVPYTAGGPSDVVTRVVANQMAISMDRPVVVENKPGANGMIGMERVARSAGDGRTLVMFSLGGSVLNTVLRDKMPYDLLKDFTAVGNMVNMAQLMVVNPRLPVKSVKDLVAYAKQNPNKLSYGSSGVGGSPHLIGELFKQLTGTEMVHVPYQGTGPATTAVMADEVQLLFTEVPVLLQNVRAGRLNAIAVGTSHRSALLPDVPTMAESGLDLSAYNWFGLQAPSSTPPDIIAYLNLHLVRALKDPATKARLQDMGAEPAPGSAADFQNLVRSELDKWGKVAQEAGIRVE